MKKLLTTEELSNRIKYKERYIRECLKDSVFKEGVHYIQPFGRRKLLFIWDEIEKILHRSFEEHNPMEKIELRNKK
jgi:hypothetical protein